MVLDTATLNRAISTIEELSEGGCRFNCRTAKDNWLAGHWYACGQPSAGDVDYKAEAARHYDEWKRNSAKYTLESEIGFIKETPHEL